MSAAHLIKKFGDKIQVFRDVNPEKSVKGKRVDDVFESFFIFASVQPLKPDEIVDEDVGSERNRHGVKVYSNQELRTVDVDKRFKADQIEYQGERFEIVQVDKWTGNKRNLQHYYSVALKLNKGVKK